MRFLNFILRHAIHAEYQAASDKMNTKRELARLSLYCFVLPREM